jgi:hypothetical protein
VAPKIGATAFLGPVSGGLRLSASQLIAQAEQIESDTTQPTKRR